MHKKYQLLSRKYRPQNFLNLLGQKILVDALSYAISNERLAQSYLLCGIRGVGKTTTARIIAKTINCTNVTSENSIPVACETCDNCRSFNTFSHPDILEIDAASRTGVDDVRSIIENAEYKPMLGRYKVFIIDEVHMLSKNAFNALLKLLEEPPLHTIFIFATTEVHKLPLTVISRCQRYDLKRLSIPELQVLLKDICTKENLNYEEEAITIIASKADGSARDSLSLLDQAIILSAQTEHKINQELVQDMVCAVDEQKIVLYLEYITQKNAEQAIKILSEHHSTNTDFSVYLSKFLGLLAYCTKKLSITNFASSEFFSINSEIDRIIKNIDTEFLQIAYQLSFKSSLDLAKAPNQLEFMEMLTLKLMHVLCAKNESVSNLSTSHTNSPENPGTNKVSASSALKSTNLNLDGFLKFLYSKKEMDLYYTLFNKSEFVFQDEKNIRIKLLEDFSKTRTQIVEYARVWSNGQINFSVENANQIFPYKEFIKNRITAKTEIASLAKQFADMKIADILIRPN